MVLFDDDSSDKSIAFLLSLWSKTNFGLLFELSTSLQSLERCAGKYTERRDPPHLGSKQVGHVATSPVVLR